MRLTVKIAGLSRRVVGKRPRKTAVLCAMLWGAFPFSSAHGSDACSLQAVYAFADVTVSDGKTYSVETFYRSPLRAATRLVRENGSLHVVEGPLAWVQSGEDAVLAGADQRGFAQGHQFHALLMYFPAFARDPERVAGIDFNGGQHTALRGTADTGSVLYLIDGDAPDRPAGVRIDIGNMKIEIVAQDWRDVGGRTLPFALTIDDGSRQFEYRYRRVDFTDKPLMWFYENVPAPALDEVQILRLHRQLLAAHCLGDAALMERLSASSVTIVSGGAVTETNPEGVETAFRGTFKRRAYSSYTDTKPPQVTVSSAGDVGWATIQVNAKGELAETGEAFDENWAWVMLAKKVDGVWCMAGNASNVRQ